LIAHQYGFRFLLNVTVNYSGRYWRTPVADLTWYPMLTWPHWRWSMG
jgi:hypothetical protein